MQSLRNCKSIERKKQKKRSDKNAWYIIFDERSTFETKKSTKKTVKKKQAVANGAMRKPKKKIKRVRVMISTRL